MSVKSLAELLAEPPRRRDWGGWLLDAESFTLHLPFDAARPDDGDLYWVALEECGDCAEVLDKVVQITNKTWATDRILGGLLRALDDVLHLQSSLCSFGVAGTLTAEVIRLRVKEVALWPAA